jgi:hypothetical protein
MRGFRTASRSQLLSVIMTIIIRSVCCLLLCEPQLAAAAGLGQGPDTVKRPKTSSLPLIYYAHLIFPLLMKHPRDWEYRKICLTPFEAVVADIMMC